MSGIAGIVSFDGAPVEPGLIEGMTTAMSHRGLDGICHWSCGSVALGHCMVHTTPESLDETQPVLNEAKTITLVMDGRVDNWEELRVELLDQGIRVRNRSDAELVLGAYERWGCECLHHIDGDYAFAVWDARRQEIFCARDRVGSKPFLYHWDGRRLVFASEPQAILEIPGIPRELNEGVVAEYIAMDWCSRDETFWEGIYRLVPAHMMVVGVDGPRIHKYWTPDLHKLLRYKQQDEYAEHYRALLFDVVRRLSRSHKPLACEVSGGLDSSAVFSVGARLEREGLLLAPAIEGYTLLFGDGSVADELDYARSVGEHLGRKLHEIRPTQEPLNWHWGLAQRHAVFPPYPNGSFALSIRQAARRADSAVLLTGVGGDQFLSGSRAYYAEAIVKGDWGGFAGCLAADAKAYGLQKAFCWTLRHGLYPLLPEQLQTGLRMVRRRAQADPHPQLTRALAAKLKLRKMKRSRLKAAAPARIGQQEQLASLLGPYSVRAKESQEWMAAIAGIELRDPLYSKPIIDFSLSVEARVQMRGSVDRRIHREAMVGFLPESVRNRTSKAEFGIAFEWYRAELKRLLEAGSLSSRGWVVAESIAALSNQAGNTASATWPSWTIWGLFGCAALANSGKS